MHRLQDYWAHYNKGYRWEPKKAGIRGALAGLGGIVIGESKSPSLGHGWDSIIGKDPDEDNAEWAKAEKATCYVPHYLTAAVPDYLVADDAKE